MCDAAQITQHLSKDKILIYFNSLLIILFNLVSKYAFQLEASSLNTVNLTSLDVDTRFSGKLLSRPSFTIRSFIKYGRVLKQKS